MDFEIFSAGLEEIFAIFNKKTPEERVVEIVYKRVKDLPPEFMAFAIRHFEDQNSLPRNMGMYLARELWPQYLERYPELQSKNEDVYCPHCDMACGIPGLRRVWRLQHLPWGDEYEPVLVRCACGNGPNPTNEPIYSDFELERMGFILKNPYPPFDKQKAMSKWMKKVVEAPNEIRPRHEAYMEEVAQAEF